MGSLMLKYSSSVTSGTAVGLVESSSREFSRIWTFILIVSLFFFFTKIILTQSPLPSFFSNFE